MTDALIAATGGLPDTGILRPRAGVAKPGSTGEGAFPKGALQQS